MLGIRNAGLFVRMKSVDIFLHEVNSANKSQARVLWDNVILVMVLFFYVRRLSVLTLKPAGGSCCTFAINFGCMDIRGFRGTFMCDFGRLLVFPGIYGCL